MPSMVYSISGKEKDESGSRTGVKDKDREKDSAGRKSSRSKRKSTSREHRRGSGAAEIKSESKRHSSMPIPELNRRGSQPSLVGSKISTPYPAFSQQFSREAIRSRESITPNRQSIFTPDPTDVQENTDKKASDEASKQADIAPPNRAPPSPPLTATDQTNVVEEKRKDLQQVAEEMRKRLAEEREARDRKSKSESRSRPSSSRNSPWKPSKSGRKDKEKDKEAGSPAQSLKPRIPTKHRAKHVFLEDGNNPSVSGRNSSISSSDASSRKTVIDSQTLPVTETGSTSWSDLTPIATKQPIVQPHTRINDDDSSPPSNSDSSPRTPTPRGTPFPVDSKETPIYIVPTIPGSFSSAQDSPMPPPPPPPPTVPFQVPRVDYLLQYGGLPQGIPKNFLFAPDPRKVPPDGGNPTDLPVVMSAQVEKFFAPFNGLLEDYTKVMSKNGSLAVATGYRSIARRLLDRLEAVFARDISSEVCSCSICTSVTSTISEEVAGVSWGEILEYVCGRRELPLWPAFVLDPSPNGLGISATQDQRQTPMQKLDIDVPEEYREHYIRQSKKTKQSVDRWLSAQPEQPSSPPSDVDDDTLTFAMLTHLQPNERSTFKSLLGIFPSRPASRVGTPFNDPAVCPTAFLLTSTSLAIQRLYRLPSLPRAPESAMYLLKNPLLHNILATLAAISDHEWEILTSGRFDGFLRSGAEEVPTQQSLPASRGPTPAAASSISRNPTPYSASIGPTSASASAGAPVTLDEETEIAVLAEIEREIYAGMETLEDAFEALHVKAEAVRRNLRERGAGLAIACQARRGGIEVEVRGGTPFLGGGEGSESEWGGDDGMSEIAPDDSASCVSRSWGRRPKRRVERRTPAPIDEEEGGGGCGRRKR